MAMFDSPLRYPGGKGRLTQHVIDLIEMNDLAGAHYCEPYAGGAGIAISLLYLEYADHIHLNDVDPSVYSFWRAIIDHTEEFLRLVRDTPMTVEEWRKQRAFQYNKEAASVLELGFSTFYANRTNRSGILRGGVIGGIDQAGKWKMDARYNRGDLIKRIEKVASYSSRISLYNRDASDLITDVLPTLPSRSLVYLDPPPIISTEAGSITPATSTLIMRRSPDRLAILAKNGLSLTTTSNRSESYIPRIASSRLGCAGPRLVVMTV